MSTASCLTINHNHNFLFKGRKKSPSSTLPFKKRLTSRSSSIRRPNRYFQEMTNWLKNHDAQGYYYDPSYANFVVTRLIRNMKNLCDQLVYDGISAKLFRNAVIYAKRYVQKKGILLIDLLNLMTVAVLVSVKFWEDSGIDNSTVAYTSCVNLKLLNQMEREFLCAIDFDLTLRNDRIGGIEFS